MPMTRRERTKQYRELVEKWYNAELEIAKKQRFYVFFKDINKPDPGTDKMYMLDYHHLDFKLPSFRNYMAAYKIQQAWRSILLNPHHPLGKKKINESYNKIFLEENN